MFIIYLSVLAFYGAVTATEQPTPIQTLEAIANTSATSETANAGESSLAPITIEEYLILCQKLEQLFVGLYGPAQPLSPYVHTIQQLLYAYAQELKKAGTPRNFAQPVFTPTLLSLGESLTEIKETSERLLRNFNIQITTTTIPAGSTATGMPPATPIQVTVPTAPESTVSTDTPTATSLPNTPSAADLQSLSQPLPNTGTTHQITITPTTPVPQQDKAFQEFFNTVKTAQTIHPAQTMPNQQTPPTLQDYVIFFVVGNTAVIAFYFLLRLVFTRNMQRLRATHEQAQNGYPRMAAENNALLLKLNNICKALKKKDQR